MKVSARFGLASMLVLALVLAACGQPQASVPEGRIALSVAIDGSQFAPQDIRPMGSPIAQDGTAATDSVDVQVFDKDGALVTFDLVGGTYTVAAAGATDTIALTASATSADVLLLAAGNPYTFEAHGYHQAGGPVIAYDHQQKAVANDASVQLWLTSVLGGARLVPRYPAAFATPGAAAFDLLLVVTANGYSDIDAAGYLQVPLGDFQVEYGLVTGATVVSSSDRGLRLSIAEACAAGVNVAEGQVTGLVWEAGSVVPGSLDLGQFDIDCPAASGGVQADLVSPVVTLAYDGVTGEATGTALDPNGFITTVEIWDGPVLVASTDAAAGVALVTFDLGSTTFRATLGSAPVGGLVALAYDAAGNEGRSDETFSSNAVWVAEGGTGDGSQADPLGSVQDAIDAVAVGGTVWVGPGTYYENLTVSKSLALLSTHGREVTTIQGSDAGGGTGTLVVQGGPDGVQIGDIGRGLHIVGIAGSAASENAAIYFRGHSTNVVVRGNELEADGDLGLITTTESHGQGVVGFDISHNVFSGKTFRGDYVGFGKWTDPNHPLALVAINPGARHVTFTNNVLNGVVGGYDEDGNANSNTLAVLMAEEILVSGNQFVSAGLPSVGMHLWVNAFEIDQQILNDNTFDRGVLVSRAGVDILYVSFPSEFGGVYDGLDITVLPGEYDLDGPIAINAQGLTIAGPNTGLTPASVRGPEATVRGSFDIRANDVTVSGLYFQEFGSLHGEHTPLYIGNDATGVAITSNVVQGENRAGRGVVSGYAYATSAHIEGNTFRDLGTGTYPNPTAAYTVQGNLFEGNYAGSANDSPNGVLSGNTYRNNLEGIGLGAAGVTVSGNTFEGAEEAYIVDYVGGYDLVALQGANTFDPVAVEGVFVPDWNPALSLPALVPQE